MPNRILREGILDSRAVNSLSEEAELYYRRLISIVDDYGRAEGEPEMLRVKCFPRRLEQWPVSRVESAMTETGECRTDDGAPLVTYYRVGSKTYVQVNNFGQRVRAEKSRCPPPNGHSDMSVQEKMTDACQSSVSSPPQSAASCDARVPEARARASAYSETLSEAEASAVPPAALALSTRPPAGFEKRIRAVAADCPDSQDLQVGIRMAIDVVKSSANPIAMLEQLLTNLPLWFEAMTAGKARTKNLRFIMLDKDYLQKPVRGSPIGRDKNQTRRDQGLQVAKVWRQK